MAPRMAPRSTLGLTPSEFVAAAAVGVVDLEAVDVDVEDDVAEAAMLVMAAVSAITS